MRKGYKPHISTEKKQLVKEYAKQIVDTPIIGVVNLENLPSAQLNVMRKKLREKNVHIVMGKRRLFVHAIESIKDKKKGIEQLEPVMKGLPALLFTTENPFALYKLIKKSKSKAAAKGGQTAPYDIVASAGATNFAPGPIISELAAFKIKTKVENGKLTIVQDTVVVKTGEVINDKLASLLLRLGIEPMEMGLDLVALYENGVIYDRRVLDIDEDKFLADVTSCAQQAVQLSLGLPYPVRDTVEMIIGKAGRDAKCLALEVNHMSKDTAADVLGKAYRQAISLQTTAGVQ